MAKTRQLDELPEQGAPDHDYREWLTPAVGCPAGIRFEDMIRHGYELTDACTFTLSGPGGDLMSFRATQGQLASPATLRATLARATHGLLRTRHLSRGEFEDIWIAMITLSNIVDSQTEADEVWSWLQRYRRECDEIVDLSFRPVYRYDALMALMARPRWGRAQALASTASEEGARPVWITDRETGEEVIRTSEFLTFLRHDVGAGPLSSPRLTARLHEIGGSKVTYEVRRGASHPRLTLYLLPVDPPENLPEAEK